jgi:site-specific DNA recombinase
MRVVLYARVSSEKQDVDLSLSAQLKALRDYAARNNYEVVKEFVDEAESGKTAARPAFREMISAARRPQKPFDVILVWKFSRFARSRQDSILFKAMLKKNGIRVVSISEPAEDTPTGKLLEAMIESLDEFYSANLGEEVTRGMRESASRGFYLSAVAPFGYRKVRVKDGSKERTKLDIKPKEAEIVSQIFDQVLAGQGLIEVAKQLNNEKIAGPKGKGWMKTSIRKILTNEVYTGTAVWGRDSKRDLPVIRVENAWPAIVDKHTFDEAQLLLKERAPVILHPRRVASRYLLSGLVRCGYCGKALVGQDAKSGQFTYYVCGTLLKKGAGSCPTHYLNSQRFEDTVLDKLKEHVLTTENLNRLVNIANEEMDNFALESNQRLDSIIDGIADVDRRLERLYDALETGKIQLADLAPRIQQLRQKREQLQAAKWKLEQQLSDRRVELADAKAVAGCLSDMRDLLTEGSFAERKTFIRSFVKEIKVTGDDALLTYTMPILPGGVTEERLSVLSIVHCGGPFWTRTRDPGLIRTVL